MRSNSEQLAVRQKICLLAFSWNCTYLPSRAVKNYFKRRWSLVESRGMKRWTSAKIATLKGRQRFSCVTAYDAVSGRLADEAGFELILVGDSLGNTALGFENTLAVTQAMMLHHTAAVARAVDNALVVGDMPFMSYQGNPDDALLHAGAFLQEAGADAVKLEGGTFRAPLIERFVRNGIPVLGHIGLTPQSLQVMGLKKQGKTAAAAQALLADAQALSQAGAFAIVLECVPDDVAGEIARATPVPVISCGSGDQCDATILVYNDVVGLTLENKPSFAKAYGDAAQTIRDALKAYRHEVTRTE